MDALQGVAQILAKKFGKVHTWPYFLKCQAVTWAGGNVLYTRNLSRILPQTSNSISHMEPTVGLGSGPILGTGALGMGWSGRVSGCGRAMRAGRPRRASSANSMHVSCPRCRLLHSPGRMPRAWPLVACLVPSSHASCMAGCHVAHVVPPAPLGHKDHAPCVVHEAASPCCCCCSRLEQQQS